MRGGSRWRDGIDNLARKTRGSDNLPNAQKRAGPWQKSESNLSVHARPITIIDRSSYLKQSLSAFIETMQIHATKPILRYLRLRDLATTSTEVTGLYAFFERSNT
jgi:hypothetical protein